MSNHTMSIRLPWLADDDSVCWLVGAIMVPPPFNTVLAKIRCSAKDEGQHIPPHVTVLPPCRVLRAGLQDAMATIRKVAQQVPAFPIQLGGVGTFRPATRVVFVRVAQGGEQLGAIANNLRRSLGVEYTFPYHPHVTIAHDVSEENLDRAAVAAANYEAEFVPAEIVLMSWCDGWEELGSVPLGPPLKRN